MPKITNDGLTRSDTGCCYEAVPIWQRWASKGQTSVIVTWVKRPCTAAAVHMTTNTITIISSYDHQHINHCHHLLTCEYTASVWVSTCFDLCHHRVAIASALAHGRLPNLLKQAVRADQDAQIMVLIPILLFHLDTAKNLYVNYETLASIYRIHWLTTVILKGWSSCFD